nr:unnamed protein product [Spirometra erinaceieuropaei]
MYWSERESSIAEATAAALKRPPGAHGRRATTQRTHLRDIATGSRRQGGQIRRYKNTLKSALKRQQINPPNWEDLARDRPTWRRTVTTGAAIHETNRIDAAKVLDVNGPSGHELDLLDCTTWTTPTVVPPSNSSSRPPTNSDCSSELPLPSSSSSSSSSSTAPRPAVVASAAHVNTARNPDPSSTVNTTNVDSRVEDQNYTCPHFDRTCTSHIGLVSHLRIHRTETGEPVSGAPTYTSCTYLHSPHCPRTFTHRMGLFGPMCIHERGIDRNIDTPTPPSPTPNSSPCAPTTHSPTDIDATDSTTPHSSPSSSSSSVTATTTITPASVAHDFTTVAPDTTTGTTRATSIIRGEGQDYSCPHCDRTFTSRIGLVGHL